MILDNILANELRPLNFALVNNNLVMLAELYLIIFNGLIEVIVLRASFLNIMNNLQQIDGDRKYLPARLQHLLIFLILQFVLFL